MENSIEDQTGHPEYLEPQLDGAAKLHLIETSGMFTAITKINRVK